MANGRHKQESQRGEERAWRLNSGLTLP
jgi:hypothetical protein